MATKRKAEEDVAEDSHKVQKVVAEDDFVDYEVLLEREKEAKKKASGSKAISCPYLDTINRSMLDFDFEKLCSVTLSNLNVYACLVCGKYYQGRGRNSSAHFHSLQANHHVFINLSTFKVFCLPDDYEVNDVSLDDIKYVLNPTYSQEEIAKLDTVPTVGRSLDGIEYIPGVVGLNNIKLNDSLNVVIQSLIRVPDLRNFFMSVKNYEHCKSNLVHSFGELIRKVWNPKNFKGQVSPHELLQAISVASKKRFKIGVQSDPIDFISWFLNTLHSELGGTKKRPTIVTKCFQGSVRITTMKLESSVNELEMPKVEESPFLFLSLDVPPAPLFKDGQERTVISQVSIYTLLEKYNGAKFQDLPLKNEKKQYKITSLPKYLILTVKRFTKNQWFFEKNATIVNFPIKYLEMKEFADPKTLLNSTPTQYDLLSNIKHEGLPHAGKGIYKVDALHKASEKWYEVQDLIVKDTMPQMIALSEAYIQFYEARSSSSTQ